MGEEKKQTEEKTGNENKKAVIIAVVAALVALAVIGGLVFLAKKYSDRKKELQALKKQMENLQKGFAASGGAVAVTGENRESGTPPAQTAPAENYAGWKTYTSSEIGYALKYPADWEITEISEHSPVLEATVKYITIYTPGNKYFLHWGLKEKGAGFFLNDRTGMGAGEEKKSGKITILGTEVDVTNFVFRGKAKEIFYPTAGSFPTSDGKHEFIATLGYGSGSDWDAADLSTAPEKALAEKILKSVSLTGKTTSSADCPKKFTNEENLNKTGWKTVSNAKNGYSLKYPKDWTLAEKQDDYLQMVNDANGEYFEWRSGPMTGTDFYGYEETSRKNISVGCQNAKIAYFSGDPTADPPHDAKDRFILVQFEKDGVPHVIIFTYKSYGASISSDIAEMFELILKTVEFSK